MARYLPDNRRDEEFIRCFRRPRFDGIFARLLVTRGADPNRKDRSGWCPVLYASRVGNVSALTFLKVNKADLSARENLGSSALHVAAINGREGAVRWLLKHSDLGPNPVNKIGATPMHWCVDCKKMNAGMLELLYASGADLNAFTVGGWRPIDFAMNRVTSGWAGDFHEIVNWLRHKNAAGDPPPDPKALPKVPYDPLEERTLKPCLDGNEKNRVKGNANQDEDQMFQQGIERAKRLHALEDAKHNR